MKATSRRRSLLTKTSIGGATLALLATACVVSGCTSDDSEAPLPLVDAGSLDANAPSRPDATTRGDGGHDATPGSDATIDADADADADANANADADADADAHADAGAPADAGPDASLCGDGGPVGTFTDDFSQGARPAYWIIGQDNPDAGVFTYADDGGDLHFAKVGNNPGGTQAIYATLDMAAVGGPVAGDFTLSVDFRNAVVGATPIDQIELHAEFEDSTIFYDSYSNENGLELHVWDGAYETGFNTTATAATMRIVRSGSTLTAYAIIAGDGGADAGAQVVFSRNSGTTSRLVNATFILQNYDTNNAISVTYDNFALSGACVHP